MTTIRRLRTSNTPALRWTTSVLTLRASHLARCFLPSQRCFFRSSSARFLLFKAYLILLLSFAADTPLGVNLFGFPARKSSDTIVIISVVHLVLYCDLWLFWTTPFAFFVASGVGFCVCVSRCLVHGDEMRK
jgi:hypothetical protein